jgi:hypothetical protein
MSARLRGHRLTPRPRSTPISDPSSTRDAHPLPTVVRQTPPNTAPIRGGPSPARGLSTRRSADLRSPALAQELAGENATREAPAEQVPRSPGAPGRARRAARRDGAPAPGASPRRSRPPAARRAQAARARARGAGAGAVTGAEGTSPAVFRAVDPDVPRDRGGVGPQIGEDLTQRRLGQQGAGERSNRRCRSSNRCDQDRRSTGTKASGASRRPTRHTRPSSSAGSLTRRRRRTGAPRGPRSRTLAVVGRPEHVDRSAIVQAGVGAKRQRLRRRGDRRRRRACARSCSPRAAAARPGPAVREASPRA